MEQDELEVKVIGKIVAATVFANDGGKAFNTGNWAGAIENLEHARGLINDAIEMIEENTDGKA